VLGGVQNCILCDDVSTILGGAFNSIQGCASGFTLYYSGNIIGAGKYNLIRCNSSKSFIGSGYNNQICRGSNSNIIGGRSNRICSTSVSTNFSNILGGSENLIQNGANWNSILGGCSNVICGASVCYNVAFGCDIQIGCGDTNVCYNAAFGCNNNICCCGKFNIVAGYLNCVGGGTTLNEGYGSAIFGGFNRSCAQYNLVAGYNNQICCNHNYSAILGTYSKSSTACNTTFMCNVCAFGSLTKASGTFKIDHPNPCKSSTHNLQHSFVESPTAGDNLYRFEVEIGEDLEGEIILPEYYRYLNENSQVWVNPMDSLGKAYGIVNLSATKVKITTSDPGKYNVLVVATRKDKAAVEAWKGVETLKNEGEITNYKNSLKNEK
jgi:hypothetical protein